MKVRLPMVAFGVVVLVACSTRGSSRSDGTLEGPVLVSPPSKNSEGMAARVTGEVILDATKGCLLLSNENIEYPVVWPHGTRWQAEPRAVVLGSGEMVPIGTRVQGGGGYLHHDAIARMAGPEVADAASACAGPTGEYRALQSRQ